MYLEVDGRLRGGNSRAELGELKTMCHDPGMPSERAVLRWSAHRPEFRRQYDIARELGQHLGAERVLETAGRAPLAGQREAGSPAQPFIAGADFPYVASPNALPELLQR